MDMALVQKIEELRRLSVPALKRRYREVFGEETRSSHKQYLSRRIVWQLQAQIEGGLSERAVDRAVQIADDADLRSSGPKGFWNWPETGSEGATPSALWSPPRRTAAEARHDAHPPPQGTRCRRPGA
jgi:hypothetical protein